MVIPTDPPETIVVLKKDYDYLEKREAFLCALEAAGVDNWDGYDFAHEMLKEWNEEESDN